MNEKEYSTLLRQKSNDLRQVSNDAEQICQKQNRCKTCPLYDDSPVNDFNSRCSIILLARYSAKLEQMADAIDRRTK